MSFLVTGLMNSGACRAAGAFANRWMFQGAARSSAGWLSRMQYLNPWRQPTQMPPVRIVSYEEMQRISDRNFDRIIEDILSK